MDPWLFRRISVRYLVDGQAFDVIGRVLHRSNDVVQLMRRDGQIEDVPVVHIIAAREVPDDKRRLRPVKDFPAEKLSRIIKLAVGALPADQRVLIASCQELPRDSHDSSTVTISTEADAHWLRLVPRADDRSKSESGALLPHAYLREGDKAATRAMVVGDWLGLHPVSVTEEAAAVQVTERLLAVARDWSEPRGAVYAFALVEPQQVALIRTLKGLGFREVPAAD